MLGWSDEGEDVEIGAVADWCDHCDDVRVFSIEEKLVQDTFVGIAFTPVYRAGRRRVCWECGEWQYMPLLKPYAELVPIEKAERMRLSTLARITNPDLYDELWDDD